MIGHDLPTLAAVVAAGITSAVAIERIAELAVEAWRERLWPTDPSDRGDGDPRTFELLNHLHAEKDDL